jgi:CubicO group peptidase (beta-lactamase class C family)
VVTTDGTPTVLTAGVRCLGGNAPVTAHTSFGIGSLTKAFTATAAAALVGDGILDWDTRTRDLIPELELADPVATELVTLRDLLAHRSGLGDHSLMEVNLDTGPGRVIPLLEHIEPAAEFRDRHLYSNLGYTLAGVMVGRAAGTSWAEVVSSRLLDPLGMSSTAVGPPSGTDVDAACGHHFWRGSVTRVDPLALDSSAPGNGLYSTATDMATWLELLLGDGEIDGRTLVERSALQETFTPQVVIRLPNDHLLDYGLGWKVSSWRGRRLLVHRGGGVGFSSQVWLLPEERVAIATLANRSVSGVPDVMAERASELILGEEIDTALLERAMAITSRVEALHDAPGAALRATADPDAAPSFRLSEYAGCYRHPAFGELELRPTGDGLAASFHGIELTVEHLHDDVFVLSSIYTDDVPASFSITDGVISSVQVDFGPRVPGRIFERVGR